MRPRKPKPPAEPSLYSRVLDGLPASAAPQRVAGFGFTAWDDDLFALGYPHLALLGPDGADPVAEARALVIGGYPYRQVVFPRHASVALTEGALAATADLSPLTRDEAQALLTGYAR
jgi:hypothetical protein